ncbi:hypothetical protein PPYR_09705 [Photinus pyralis]|uniref:C2H2-type domain-containing protein n=1 Tax=Photinus pyralis TaxID=7054 RepID=A0A1Y1MV17_PHOPY|nr:zinc finger protein 385D-like [Photinus pyralis]KAB0798712.1 hypothetical protein PPYR_09705 [Photinus pyralis]
MSTELEMCIANLGEAIPTINNNYVTAEIEEKTKEWTYTCDICKINTTSHKVLLRHYEGRKHKVRVERAGKIFNCDLCQVNANSQKQLDNHLKSSRHKYQLEKKDLIENLKLNGNRGVWVILFGIGCVFVNFLLIFKLWL